ncbi:MAG: hypothetical protein D6758_09830 [Gammaproteobacteria bacterium]|nr:MAG: hypothetical protein D6758_09830 [Gammaproteobacteria bacterium]
MLRDGFETHSLSFLACYKGQPAGTLRLTPLHLGSPLLRLFNTRVPTDPTATAELGRFAVMPAFRKQGRLVTAGLTAAMFLASVRLGIRWWVGYTPEGLLRSFSQVFDARPLAQPSPDSEHLQARSSMPGYFERYEHQLVCFHAPVASASPAGWLKRMPGQLLHRLRRALAEPEGGKFRPVLSAPARGS